MKNKIILNQKKLKKILELQKRKGKKIIFTNGCFDLLHFGHIKYLNDAKKLGGFLIVALNSDNSVRKIKGKGRPLTSEKDRLQIISSLEMVDQVTLFNDRTPLKLIKLLNPDIIVKGADWKLEDIVGGDFVKGYGGSVRQIPYSKGYSTSKLIRKIAKRN
ncbi:MAG: D-glycero-beta-D-manno-heptose 1-phosphate adenylyltransferase [Candidatus Omnitrophica bacterium]|nr:D-glycero-beta-D-manno-heptose 1-phosphate adenylyltransferase [Candidatus Omnitrophota bacterium]